ncbi:uncharacterized protein [Amphiura filiformis]|uniref:uncharacterized protein isoform X2 n=1 Tax=Amphiura filiformis TaxID=82378 RepID=UPI003B21696E
MVRMSGGGNNPVPATMPPLVPVTNVSTTASNPTPPPRKTLQETIRDIETSIKSLESRGTLNGRQEQDLAKLKELHKKALVEQERLRGGKIQQQPGANKSPGSSAPSPASNSTPNSTGNSTTTPTGSGGMAPPAMASSSPLTGASGSSTDPNQVLNKKRLQDLVKEIDPNTQLDEDVEEMLLQVADDFIENLVTAGCQLAKHRKSGTLEVKDILLHLERNWNMMIPGYGSDEGRAVKRPSSTEAHKQRMALIRKTLKK